MLTGLPELVGLTVGSRRTGVLGEDLLETGEGAGEAPHARTRAGLRKPAPCSGDAIADYNQEQNAILDDIPDELLEGEVE